MPKDTMPKPDTGVHRRWRSTGWQWRIKTPIDLRAVYPTEWAHRASLRTADVREANAEAAKLRAEWLARFDEQRRELNPQKADKLTPELAQVLAQRVAARLLADDQRLRTDPDAAKTLLRVLRTVVPSKLTIAPRHCPLGLRVPAIPWRIFRTNSRPTWRN
jgi:hypothetical protein